jgi:hypothetical protein
MSEQVTVQDHARRLLGERTPLDQLSEAEIKGLVVRELLDGQSQHSAAYIDSAFSVLCETENLRVLQIGRELRKKREEALRRAPAAGTA